MAYTYEMKVARAAASKVASAAYASWRDESTMPEWPREVTGKTSSTEPKEFQQAFNLQSHNVTKRSPKRASSVPRVMPSNSTHEKLPRLGSPKGSVSGVSCAAAECGKSLRAAGTVCTSAAASRSRSLVPSQVAEQKQERRQCGVGRFQAKELACFKRFPTPSRYDQKKAEMTAQWMADEIKSPQKEKVELDPENVCQPEEVLEVLQCQHCRRPFPVVLEAGAVDVPATQESAMSKDIFKADDMPAVHANPDVDRAMQKRRALKKAREALAAHEERCRKRQCGHCCKFFRTPLECHGHSIVCAQNETYRCEFCQLRTCNLGEKKSHEATCEQNPELWCDWCGARFPHSLLRNRHQRACPRDPRKKCRYCNTSFPSRHDTVVHEVACAMNTSTKAEADLCVACCEQTQCFRFPCGSHSYCAACISGMVDIGLKDRTLLPLRCCKQEVKPGDTIDVVVGKMLPDRKREKYHETMLLKMSKNVMYCPRAECGALISLDSLLQAEVEVDGPFGCPKCSQALCFTCRTEWHAGLSCEQYQFLVKKTKDPFINYCRDMNFMRCLDCGHAVEKKSGCNHITCICGSEFCYLCGTKWGECRCQVMGDGHLLRHNRTGAVASFPCPACNQQYPSQAELNVHLRVCRRAIEASGGAFECSNCLSRYPTGEALRVHRRKCWAVQEDLFGCSHCRDSGNRDYIFVDQGSLRQHRRFCGVPVPC